MLKWCFLLLLSLAVSLPVTATPEGMPVHASPTAPLKHDLPLGEKVADYAVSADGHHIMIASTGADGQKWLKLFEIDAERSLKEVNQLKLTDAPVAVTAHPEQIGTWFVTVKAGEKGPWNIMRFHESAGKFAEPTLLHSTANSIRRLVLSSRPFKVDWQDKSQQYRIVFSELQTGIWRMRSVKEDGSKLVDLSLLTLPKKPWTCPKDAEPSYGEEGLGCTLIPSTIKTPNGALPISFHPSGKSFRFEDSHGCTRSAVFVGQWTADDKEKCGRPTFYHPNGVLTYQWSKGKAGIEIFDHVKDSAPKGLQVYSSSTFLMPPVFLPDGRSVVGIENSASGQILVIIPYVEFKGGLSNLWRFEEITNRQLQVMEKSGGFFTQSGQRYFDNVYDAANYASKPVIVTTDPLWYLVSIADEAGFVMAERRVAIHAYRRFLDGAIAHLSAGQQSGGNLTWKKIFLVARGLLNGVAPGGDINQDYESCKNATGSKSKLLGDHFNFRLCKPRSHYESDPELQNYWRSFEYFTLGTSWDPWQGKIDSSLIASFPKLPAEVMRDAVAWFSTYEMWMAPATFPALREASNEKRWTPSHPFQKCGLETELTHTSRSIFPLGWGWDDEIVCMIMEKNERNANAQDWLKSFTGEETRTFFKNTKDVSLYTLYLRAISETLTANQPEGIFAKVSAQFLQARASTSALGAWTHLKHKLQLVSAEPSGAEGGEGGPGDFETLAKEDPTGAIEPRPTVFTAQKKVVDEVIRLVKPSAPPDFDERLEELSKKLELFAKAAELQRQGRALDKTMIDEIDHFGGFLEHADIYYNSILHNFRYADANLTMALIASVGNYTYPDGSYKKSYFATGLPLSTYVVIDEKGKKRITIGASFSTYSFESDKMISDLDWRKDELPKASLPDWMKDFLVN